MVCCPFGVIRHMKSVLVFALAGAALSAHAWMEHNAPDFKWTSAKVRLVPKAVKERYIAKTELGMDDKFRFEAEVVTGKVEVVEAIWFQYASVGEVDLNDDGVLDAVILVPWCGCGLAASGINVGFLVSDGKGGRMLTTMEGYGQDLGDIAEIDGKRYFMSSIFLRGEAHNYWLYRPYEFCKDGTVKDASATVGKPFPALTIYYDARKFKAQTITPSLQKMIDEGANVETEKFMP